MKHHQKTAEDRSADALANGLGWLSIGVGLMELTAPRTLARALGMEDRAGLLQVYGVREIATGIGILCARDARPWIVGRIAGDALDLATLASGMRGDNPRRGAVEVALAAVTAVTLVDAECARRLESASRQPVFDYSDRSGFPAPPDQMRGRARTSNTATSIDPQADLLPQQPPSAEVVVPS